MSEKQPIVMRNYAHYDAGNQTATPGYAYDTPTPHESVTNQAHLRYHESETHRAHLLEDDHHDEDEHLVEPWHGKATTYDRPTGETA